MSGADSQRIGKTSSFFLAGRRFPVAAGVLLLAPFVCAPLARAECVYGVYANPTAPFDGNTLFPNWRQAPTASFMLAEMNRTVGCASGPIVGVTILNYGTADGTGDIVGMYFRILCGGTDSGMVAMTYAGEWVIGADTHPAWTWSGSIPFSGDPCEVPAKGCYCWPDFQLFTDIGPCPADGATVELGPGYNDGAGTVYVGGIHDDAAVCGCEAPWEKVVDPALKYIRYMMKKADKDTAAPGDTVFYTIYYSTPSTGNLSSITIIDTFPAYMHVLPGGISPPADPGWDPDPGPPARLRWTVPGPIPTAWGRTSAIVFSATVDWGNMGTVFDFPLDAGDFGAPEGEFLFNSTQMSWDDPAASCSPGRVSNATSTSVRRYLFWTIGDNDVLFAPRIGMADDEIIYEIFVKNMSTSKTWWRVKIWDTVPALIDVWSPGFGFDDPFLGWTMSPSGAATANPGSILSGGDTLLTWTTDMPPAYTLTLKWKGKLKGTAKDSDRIYNRACIMALGDPGKVEGTGGATRPRSFTHEATVVLRTTYVSYVGWAGDDSAFFSECINHTYWISFYPMNKAADFALYKKWCCGSAPCDTTCAGFALNGGVSPKIDIYAGQCTTGPPIDWEVGCKIERAPARFTPNDWSACLLPAQPFNFLHKLVANAPVLWELSTSGPKNSADADTYVGTTSLSFVGYMAYTWLRNSLGDHFDSLHIVNTDDDTSTLIVVFRWDPSTFSWNLFDFQDLYKGSLWTFGPQGTELNRHFRVLSSSSKLIAHKAYVGFGAGGAYNDMGTLAPNRENGNLVSSTVPATFYLLAGHLPGIADVAMVGNVGPAKATYEIWKYAPYDSTAPLANTFNVTVDLVSNAGYWTRIATHTVDPAAPMPGPTGANPHVYGDAYDQSTFLARYRLYKVKLIEGGPIQTYCGMSIMDRYSGGCMLHSTDPAGDQTGLEYWLHVDKSDHEVAGCGAIMCFDVFSPKINLTVNCKSSAGYDATFTTTNVDQCVAYRALTPPAKGATDNWKIRVLAAGNPGEVIAQYICCNIAEKFYTAPFLQRGVYYEFIHPPVVYSGQSFWMTVVVMESGATKIDYCGTSTFTSSDAKAQIESTPMGSYSYVWSSDVAGCNSGGDNGVRIFVQVRLEILGRQSLIASDTIDGSITGITTILVVGVDVKLTKEPPLQIAASGDLVQFKICWSNYSSASASNFVITDQVPGGFTYVQDQAQNHFCGATKGFGAATIAYSTTDSSPGAFQTMPGAGVTGATWLRWTVPEVGVDTTGCGCFKVRVD